MTSTLIRYLKGAVRSALVVSLFAAASAAQAAAPMSYGPVVSDVLINRPDVSPNYMPEVLWSVRGEGRLLRENIRIYRCLGHQAGRYINSRKGLPDIGDGPCRRLGRIRY